MDTIIKPQPHTISNALNLSFHITPHDTHNLIASSSINYIGNALNISPNIVVSSTLSVDKINEYLEELFDDQEREIDDEFGWCFGGFSAMGNRVDFVNQVDGQNNSFDFPIEDVDMMSFLD
ncbi:uncharacterized protein LOC143534984 [Bidens hawaiensis]|uniref:uncharacterized protein LOC143534984 n=1 Tax=Bidens hawaiensis TaxID=980011 RepID=UPI00404AB891